MPIWARGGRGTGRRGERSQRRHRSGRRLHQSHAGHTRGQERGDGMNAAHDGREFVAILWRELLRFVQQRERFFAALVIPLVWLLVFAYCFCSTLGLHLLPPSPAYITSADYYVPRLLG